MKFTWKITEAWFLHVREKLFQKLQYGKTNQNERIIYGIKTKRREARQNRKEKRKKAIKKKITEDEGVPMKKKRRSAKRKEWKKKVKLKR